MRGEFGRAMMDTIQEGRALYWATFDALDDGGHIASWKSSPVRLPWQNALVEESVIETNCRSPYSSLTASAAFPRHVSTVLRFVGQRGQAKNQLSAPVANAPRPHYDIFRRKPRSSVDTTAPACGKKEDDAPHYVRLDLGGQGFELLSK